MRFRTILLGAIVSLAALGGPLAGSAMAASPSAAAAATTCTEGHWPATVQGMPIKLKAGASAGDYLWHDANGWHLRVTHVGSRLAIFTGRIVSTAPMTAVPVRLEGRDRISLSADRKVLTYRFDNFGAIDGLNFRTACARQITVAGSLNWARLPVSRIWIGHAGRHPLQNPFVIRRVA